MSLACITRVLYNSRLQANQRMVLIAIADNADDIGVAWPGIPTIAKKMGGVSQQTVRTSMRAAMDAKELLIAWGGGRAGANVYWVTVGLPSEYPWPDEFSRAVARSRRFVAMGKVKLPNGMMLPTPLEVGGGATFDPSNLQEGSPPLEVGGGEGFDPSRISTDPSNLQEGAPSNLQEGNRHLTCQEPGAREADALLRQIRRHVGEAAFGSWFAEVRLRPETPGDMAGAIVIEAGGRFQADRIRQDFADKLEKGLGRRVHVVARTPCAAKTNGQEGKA